MVFFSYGSDVNFLKFFQTHSAFIMMTEAPFSIMLYYTFLISEYVYKHYSINEIPCGDNKLFHHCMDEVVVTVYVDRFKTI